VVDLRPFVRRQHGPDRLVDAAEALKIRIASLAIAPRRLVDHEKGTGRVPQRLHQAKLAVRVKVMDRQAAPRDVGGLRPPRDRLDEIAMVKLDLERHVLEIVRCKLERGLGKIDSVIVTGLGVGEGPHLARVATGNAEKKEGRGKAPLEQSWTSAPTSQWESASASTSFW